MTPDPLERLLRAADGGASPPPDDLGDRVRYRFARQQAQVRALRRSVITAGVLMLAVIGVWALVASRGPTRPALDAQEIAQLRREADELGARADALQRSLESVRREVSRQELREEAGRLIASSRETDPGQAAIDRAALIAVTEGDFSWQVRRDKVDAQAAYKRAMQRFPESQWATVARQRLEQLNMN